MDDRNKAIEGAGRGLVGDTEGGYKTAEAIHERLRAATAYDPTGGHTADELTLSNIDDAFTYHSWNYEQQQAGDQVREALVAAAKAILRTVPRSPFRTRALNNLMDARMLANAAITFRGRF